MFEKGHYVRNKFEKLLIEFTVNDLVNHFEHKINDPTAEEQCVICKKLINLQRHVPELKKLLEKHGKD